MLNFHQQSIVREITSQKIIKSKCTALYDFIERMELADHTSSVSGLTHPTNIGISGSSRDIAKLTILKCECYCLSSSKSSIK